MAATGKPEAGQPKTQESVTGGGSALRRYQRVIVGSDSLARLAYFELCMLLSPVPGALGLFLRKLLWPRLFGSCGGGTMFGTGVSLRHPHRIRLGDRVVVADGCVLDARTEDAECALEIGDDVILADDVTISCKSGRVRIGDRVGLGTQSVIHAVGGCSVTLGDDLIIGPRCYLAGGGNYRMERTDVPMAQQGLREDDPVVLEGDNWLGANVTVLAGVTMGRGSVAAAGAVIRRSVPPLAICAGVPAEVIRMREGAPTPASADRGSGPRGSAD